ncbi:hypothetical protein QO002_005720 [Pararhizobium capsulatum DSM 1112]|uniref:Uncharacterized protein n=1 Tax=Pararhizobium capsulatum DSM 1112 TaxID=1121113 RepID=A0ABU0C0P4_9HYPH|nr:hypothetical protein [Pararhizobium capsulatum DSM 1112]
MSENKVAVKSGRKLAVENDLWEIRDNGMPVTYVDMLTELRHHNNVIYLSLGQSIIDGKNEPIVNITARHRIDLGTAKNLHRILGEVIADIIKPGDKSQAN